MTQEEKQLLLIDLCARLPYGNTKVKVTKPTNDIMNGVSVGKHICFPTDIEDVILGKFIIRPYLRPMSSMTEEDIHSLFNAMYPNLSMMWYEKEADLIRFRAADYNNKRFLNITLWFNKIYSLEQIDWLNENMFDYRGLIKKGLALEAPKDMYKTK